MSVFGTNPVHGLAAAGAAHQQAAKDAEQKSPAGRDTPRTVNRLDDSVEFEDATKHATSDDGGKRRRQHHEQQREQQAKKKPGETGLDVQG
jgi:hypothetical protein